MNRKLLIDTSCWRKCLARKNRDIVLIEWEVRWANVKTKDDSSLTIEQAKFKELCIKEGKGRNEVDEAVKKRRIK